MALDVYFGRIGRFPDAIKDTSSIFLYPSTTKALMTFAGVVMSCSCFGENEANCVSNMCYERQIVDRDRST